VKFKLFFGGGGGGDRHTTYRVSTKILADFLQAKEGGD
jgi:hypothetical protein